jgi:hypothetical protein
VRFLRFDWVVERDGKTVAHARHLWDRYDGRYRVEWESRDGEAIVALFNVNTRAGRARVNGQPLVADAVEAEGSRGETRVRGRGPLGGNDLRPG